jgi:hypothetical protein
MQVSCYACGRGYEGREHVGEENKGVRLQKSVKRLFHDLSYDLQEVLSDLSLLVMQVVKDLFVTLQEIFSSPYDGCFRRLEKWDFASAIDKETEARWNQFASRVRKGASFYESATSSLFLTDAARASYYLGKIKAVYSAVASEKEGEPAQTVKDAPRINQQWVRFLKSELGKTGPTNGKTRGKNISQAQLHLLRYELQDLANQRLFVLSEKLLEQASNAYKQAGFVLSNGAGTKAQDSIEYQLFVKEKALVLRCNKIFSVHQSSSLKCFGYDGLSVDVSVDLEQFQPSALLTKQSAGCVRASVKQVGFSPWFEKIEALMPQ